MGRIPLAPPSTPSSEPPEGRVFRQHPSVRAQPPLSQGSFLRLGQSLGGPHPAGEEPRWKPLSSLASRWACPPSVFLDPHLARGERGQKAFAFHRGPTSHSLPWNRAG